MTGMLDNVRGARCRVGRAAAAGAAMTAGLFLSVGMAAAQAPPAGLSEAFTRIAAVADAAESRQVAAALWGVTLDAPVVLHDPATATSWHRSAADAATSAVVLGKDQPPANTCIVRDGQHNVMLLLPLPVSREGLATLYWHEQWHCVQAALGLPAAEGHTAHLDGESGRVAMRLELRALAQALSSTDDRQARQHAVAALRFRAQRANLAAPAHDALAEEAVLERNEGLAEYTGRIVAGAAGGDPAAAVVSALAKADTATSFVRSAAYVTGPAYGLLLDRWSSGWRREVSRTTVLPVLLSQALGTGMQAAQGDEQRYGAVAVRDEEQVRAKERAERSAGYRLRLAGSQAVRAPLRKPSVSFDPRTLFPLDELGTVYTPVTVRDAWGELTAASGGLLAADWSLFSVEGGTVRGCGGAWAGPGWTLRLEDGWRLEQDALGWRVVPQPSLPCGQ